MHAGATVHCQNALTHPAVTWTSKVHYQTYQVFPIRPCQHVWRAGHTGPSGCGTGSSPPACDSSAVTHSYLIQKPTSLLLLVDHKINTIRLQAQQAVHGDELEALSLWH